jgi:hypothetical protein
MPFDAMTFRQPTVIVLPPTPPERDGEPIRIYHCGPLNAIVRAGERPVGRSVTFGAVGGRYSRPPARGGFDLCPFCWTGLLANLRASAVAL